MSIEEKVGQLLITAVNGTELNDESIGLIKQHRIGGVIFAKENVIGEDQTKEFIRSFKRLSVEDSEVPMFFAISETGGDRSVFPETMKATQSPDQIGAIGDVDQAYTAGKQIADNMRALGFNLNFAPVANMSFGASDTEFETQTFAGEPQPTAEMVQKFLQGLQEGSVFSAAKYFPANVDPSNPYLSADVEMLKNRELVPFRTLAENKVPMMVLSHVFVKALDDELPISLSDQKKELLKGFEYEGILIADDITKPIIAEKFGIEQSSVMAIRSGCDMILVGDPSKAASVANRLVKAVKEGELSVETVNNAVFKVLMLKAKL